MRTLICPFFAKVAGIELSMNTAVMAEKSAITGNSISMSFPSLAVQSPSSYSRYVPLHRSISGHPAAKGYPTVGFRALLSIETEAERGVLFAVNVAGGLGTLFCGSIEMVKSTAAIAAHSQMPDCRV
jgi:hypothetical protein